ncbi:uncharacterized protein LOC123504242 isoform X2 [Portunus trituberculatus]|uniref:uncharacterized protein LOC123504242 isoform X1 n=1 Tax=Portunus trituberculatus TaxID=210409 RepID=UPI001E1CCF96|nr:uncharacterized protein LOC123504242 isoform X1 [Portunus trituberculatus]XP_045110558.1 uncharacterized protein LOC123504242 isoform X2 [Portunus trituberculatus]
MKQLLLVCAVAAIASQSLATSFDDYNPAEYSVKSLHSPISEFPLVTSEKSDPFMGVSSYKVFDGTDLTRDELMAIIGSGFGPLMKISLNPKHTSGMQEYKDVSMAMVEASRQVLESRVEHGLNVDPQRFVNLDNVERRLPAVLDAMADVFDGKTNPSYSLTNLFKVYDFEPADRSRFRQRVLMTISRVAFQANDSSITANLKDASNVFLDALRKYLEDRVESGREVTQDQYQRLERAEKLMPSLMLALQGIANDPQVVEFLKALHLDATEEARQLVLCFFASMEALFMDPNATLGTIMRDVVLAYIPSARQVFEDRIAMGLPVSQDDIDKMEHMEQVLPIMLTSYIEIVDDMGIY